MSDRAARVRSVVVAGHTGDRDALTAALADHEAKVRAAALSGLERLGLLDARALEQAFTDPDPVVRRRSAELAATHPEVDLTPALHDSDVIVMETAAWACGEHERVADHVLVRLISLATTSEHVLVREAAAAALGAIGDPRGLPAVLTACSDKPTVRRRAVLALAAFVDDPDRGDDVDAAIERALDDRDWQVRQAAEDLRRALADDPE
jgi:HEAT repeat protein